MADRRPGASFDQVARACGTALLYHEPFNPPAHCGHGWHHPHTPHTRHRVSPVTAMALLGVAGLGTLGFVAALGARARAKGGSHAS